MSSLFWKISSDRFKNCTSCKVIDKGDYKSVQFCDPCKIAWKTEEENNSNLPPTPENIREIINGRLELFECDAIYQHFYHEWEEDMPYGTRKARDGDPYEWVFYRMCEEFSHLIEEAS